MQHVGAGDVDEGEGFPAFPRMREDVVEVVGAIETEGGVWIAGQTGAAGVHEVEIEREIVGRSGWIGGFVFSTECSERNERQRGEEREAEHGSAGAGG